MAAPVRNIIHHASGRPRRVAGSVLISAALLVGVLFGPMMARANHRFDARHRERAGSNDLAAWRDVLAADYGLIPIWLWRLATWKAAHPDPPSPQPAPVLTDATSTTMSDWACVRLYESGDRYNAAAPGGAYGFLEVTWLSLGYSGLAVPGVPRGPEPGGADLLR